MHLTLFNNCQNYLFLLNSDAKLMKVLIKYFDKMSQCHSPLDYSNLIQFFSEFLKNDKNLFPYNCERKEEFIKKGVGT